MRTDPAARVAVLSEAASRLTRLQREMTRLSRKDKEYESNRRALQTAIREIRKVISASVQ